MKLPVSQLNKDKKMENAKCTGDGMIYSAPNFSLLAVGDLERKRRLLQCPECGGPAFFRHASPIGRAACFGARPHAHGCGMATQDDERFLNGGSEDQDALQIPRAKIVVDFGYGSPDQPEFVDDGAGRASCFPDNRCSHYSQEHRRPSTLLRLLIESPEFRDSDLLINFQGENEIPVKDFFVPLLSVSDQFIGQFRGYWGLLSGVGYSKNKSTIWFNSGGLDTISFCLNTIYLDEFIRRYRVRDEEDLAGAYILVFGTLQVAANGKHYCVIEDLDFMALRFT